MISPEFEVELRKHLVRRALRQNFGIDEAEDLAGEAWLQASLWGENLEKPQVETAKYAFRVLHNLCVDRWSSPERIISKRVNRLQNLSELSELEFRILGGVDVVSAKPWSGDDFLDIEAFNDVWSRIDDFVTSQTGLGGANPGSMPTRAVISCLLRWLESNASVRLVISILAKVVAPKAIEIPYDDSMDEPTPAHEYSDFGNLLWKAILELPYRMKAAVLLRLDMDAVQLMAGEGVTDLSEHLNDWTPPPGLTTQDLPIDDSVVAEKLDIKPNYLQVIRHRARLILEAAVPMNWTDLQAVTA